MKLTSVPSAHDIALARLVSQKLISDDEIDPAQLVSWFGAMQAQDFPMSRFAIGARLSNYDDGQVAAQIDSGSIIRTHVLRPTWHLVANEDVRWMLDLTSGNIRRQMNSSSKALGLDQKIYDHCNDILRSVLKQKHLTREQIYDSLRQHGIETGTMRGLHILMNAELDQVICSGKNQGSKPTYALMDERVSKIESTFSKDEALSALAKRYFQSHGPASLKDFTWWSGLSVSDARKAIESITSDLKIIELNSDKYFHYHDLNFDSDVKQIALLPSFDEFLISYKDRSAAIETHLSPQAFTRNGIFNPLIIINGRVAGTWKRTVKNDTVTVETSYFYKVGKDGKSK